MAKQAWSTKRHWKQMEHNPAITVSCTSLLHTHRQTRTHTSTPTLSCILDLFMVCSCHSEGHLLTYIDSSVWVTRDGNATSRCPSVCSGVKIGQRSGENQWKNGIHTISNKHHGREQKVWAVSLCHVCCRLGLGKSATVRKCINIRVSECLSLKYKFIVRYRVNHWVYVISWRKQWTIEWFQSLKYFVFTKEIWWNYVLSTCRCWFSAK